MAQFEHIAIIGLGLMGGSFALAARAAGFDGLITGWDSQENLALALESAIIDEPEESFQHHQHCRADLIYLAMPVSAIIDFLKNSGNQIKTGALVTDCGSTKRAICQAAEILPSEINFIGGHPMAGSQHRGITAASANLFNNAVYLLTPRAGTSEAVILQFELLVRELGAQPQRLSAEQHDHVVAQISHLPQLLSTAMMAAAVDRIEALKFAGSGFHSMSRLAHSSWSVWQDICDTNRDNIGAALDQMIALLSEMRTALTEAEMQAIAEAFARSRAIIDAQATQKIDK